MHESPEADFEMTDGQRLHRLQQLMGNKLYIMGKTLQGYVDLQLVDGSYTLVLKGPNPVPDTVTMFMFDETGHLIACTREPFHQEENARNQVHHFAYQGLFNPDEILRQFKPLVG